MLMQAVESQELQPDMAQQVYESLGLDPTYVGLAGVRESVSKLNPGDLVAWGGGDRPDGTYAGNVAVYVGEGTIMELYFGQVRQRRLRQEENVYGLPVHFSEPDNDAEALSGPEPTGPPYGASAQVQAPGGPAGGLAEGPPGPPMV